MKAIDKKALERWDDFKKALYDSTIIDHEEFAVEKIKRIAYLEANQEEWFKYYFPAYATSEPASFHKTSTRRIINKPEWTEIRAWSRELAKSTRTMMEIMYLALTKKKRNVILVSNSEANAIRLLQPYKDNFEANQRIENDYGRQPVWGQWEASEFLCACGVSFRALGAGQSPRGTRNKALRPDVIIIDDIDTDEDCRNPDIIDKKWKWIEKALIPTRSISVPLLLLFCGNIIAEYCCITEAIKKADKTDIINIRTAGKSSWPQKNSEEHIDRVLSQISFSAAQGEYFNNPITEGKVFKDITTGAVPDLKKFRFLVAYGDPAPSNTETKKNSFKSVSLLGMIGNTLYVIKTFLEQTQNAKFIDWFYDIRDYVNDKTVVFYYIENNKLQDPFFQQVFKPLFFEKGKTKGLLSILPDERAKPDKFARIEGNLEPINRVGCLVFNEKELDNPHMQRLIDQFKAVSPTNKSFIDGPDAVEGGYFILKQKYYNDTPLTINNLERKHKNRM